MRRAAGGGYHAVVPFLRPSLARLFAGAFLLIPLASCGRKGTVLVALDEAFSAARPGLARELGDRPWPGYRVRALPLRLLEGPGKVLDELRAEDGREGPVVALIASPLLAAALPGPWREPGAEESCVGKTALLVPEWRAEPPAAPLGAPGRGGYALAATDATTAYRAAGAAAGGYLASLRAAEGGGGAPACAALFLESPSRPRAALEAFARAYEDASGGAPLLVRELAPSDDEKAQAEAAVRELLGSDLRLLFVAIGGGGSAAVGAARRPGLLIGGDFPGPEIPDGIAFCVRPDDRGIAKALRGALSRDLSKGASIAVPARIEAMPAGRDSGRKALAPFLRAAADAARRPGR